MAIAIATALLGCAATHRYLSPESGYAASDATAKPYEEARTSCLAESEFHGANGTPYTNWEKFERCMAAVGWVRE